MLVPSVLCTYGPKADSEVDGFGVMLHGTNGVLRVLCTVWSVWYGLADGHFCWQHYSPGHELAKGVSSVCISQDAWLECVS
jgi:hypothetical protein